MAGNEQWFSLWSWLLLKFMLPLASKFVVGLVIAFAIIAICLGYLGVSYYHEWRLGRDVRRVVRADLASDDRRDPDSAGSGDGRF